MLDNISNKGINNKCLYISISIQWNKNVSLNVYVLKLQTFYVVFSFFIHCTFLETVIVKY
jgi:hypothetical protein